MNQRERAVSHALRILALAVLLIAVVAGAAVVLDTGNQTGGSEPTAEERTVTIAVGLDTEAQQNLSGTLSQDEQELLQRSQLAPDSLSTAERQRVEEIQQEMDQAQQEAVKKANSEFESAVDSTDTLSIEGKIQQGSSSLYLVSGSPPEIVNLLDENNVQALASRSQYNQLERQQSPNE